MLLSTDLGQDGAQEARFNMAATTVGLTRLQELFRALEEQRRTCWILANSDGVEFSAGIGKFLGAGISGGKLYVKMDGDKSHTFVLPYLACGVSIGIGLAPPVAASASDLTFPSTPGRIYQSGTQPLTLDDFVGRAGVLSFSHGAGKTAEHSLFFFKTCPGFGHVLRSGALAAAFWMSKGFAYTGAVKLSTSIATGFNFSEMLVKRDQTWTPAQAENAEQRLSQQQSYYPVDYNTSPKY